MLVSAASNAAAAEVLREFVRNEVIARLSLAAGGGAGSELRAELAGSHLIGVALVRYVYRIPPLSDVPLDNVVGPVGRAIQGYLTAGAPTDIR